MKEMLQFEQSITNPAGIEWDIGSGADVGADLYMVAPVASAPGPRRWDNPMWSRKV